MREVELLESIKDCKIDLIYLDRDIRRVRSNVEGTDTLGAKNKL
jgi:hypothetical protein